MKYTVKNCPAYLGADCVGFGNGGCDICIDCCDICIDCPIKRVIEKCKEETKPIRIYEDKDKGTAIAEYSLSKDFAQEILDMFDVEVGKWQN